MSLVADLEIYPKRAESDHAPIRFTLKINNVKNQGITESNHKTLTAFKWDPYKVNEYNENYKSKHCQDTLDQLLVNTIDPISNSDGLCKIYYEYINGAIRNTFKTKGCKQNTKSLSGQLKIQ